MTLHRKVLPAPLMSSVLFALWLMLARSVSIGHVAIALGLAIMLPLVTSKLRLSRVHVRRPLVVVRFILIVGYDVVRSNVDVAWDVLRWRWRRPQAAFVTIPLDLRDPVGLAALAMVTTVVPGTVWSELALDRTTVLLHVWNVEEESAFIARFKDRYEKPLREIFE